VGDALGVVFVGTRDDTVYAVEDRDRDHVGETVTAFRDDLNGPSGVAFADGYLYVSERHRLTRYAAAELDSARRDPQPEVIFSGFPDETHHGTRYTRVGPDGAVHVALGVPCNICEPPGDSDAILRFVPDDNGGFAAPAVYADGIRNAVGMDFHPATGTLFFTDNGVDNLGDERPPGELNRVTAAGQHFGFPWYAGGNVRDPAWADREPPTATVAPVAEFRAHVAPLGLHFYRGDMLPEATRGDAFVAQHGSWNRSTPIGYRIVRVDVADDGSVRGHAVFINGWLGDDGTAWGRPVDVAALADGSLLVSDDYQGVIYRITYTR
ncbi:MAG: PQQ-dependent sugar dehydrogenase, partial [Gammaproteobacteria bacterium]